MYKVRDSLVFPRLRFVREGKLQTPNWGKNTSIYRLDWLGFDDILRRRHEKWKDKNHPDKDIPFLEGLPEPYNTVVKNSLFALDKDYVAEIKRCAYQANYEWSMEKPFDTMIRDACLSPSIAYVRTAFYLLGDCLYNEGDKYFERGPLSSILFQAMLARFWRHQTGGGMVEEHAEFSKLKEWNDHWADQSSAPNKETALKFQARHREVSNFFSAYKQYELDLEEAYSDLTMTLPVSDAEPITKQALKAYNIDFEDCFATVKITGPADQQRFKDGHVDGVECGNCTNPYDDED